MCDKYNKNGRMARKGRYVCENPSTDAITVHCGRGGKWVQHVFGSALLLAGLVTPVAALSMDALSEADIVPEAALELAVSSVASHGSIDQEASGELLVEAGNYAPVPVTASADIGPGREYAGQARSWTWSDGNVSVAQGDALEKVSLGNLKLSMAEVTRSEARVTQAILATPSPVQAGGSQSELPPGTEAAEFPYSIPLAILALLGLVSVARRDAKTLKS
jgi:hypothetical protein